MTTPDSLQAVLAGQEQGCVVCGDSLSILADLPRAAMIFADPPDNLGVEYDGFEDHWASDDKYTGWLLNLCLTVLSCEPEAFWISYYWKWDFALKGKLANGGVLGYQVKPYVWWYTFGVHNSHDNASCFRPMLRFSRPGKKWNTSDIREPSARTRVYEDERADPKGRVPGDVWDGVWEESRVCGTFKEKRKWHKNQHPEALVGRMILMSTQPGDLVIDMCAGTGTVHRVCKRLGRRCIGIDISEFYCRKIAEENGLPLVMTETEKESLPLFPAAKGDGQ
jgi:site-specific DNA-methyltransferase (adenine-specific)